MQTIVIYPGRFHPFHRGHKGSYDYLTDRFGEDSVFIATSNKQDPNTSPFTFADKRHMMAKMGIPTGHVMQVKNPYRADEITKQFDPTETALIFALSEKDTQRINFGARRDGSRSYLQPYPGEGKPLRPMSEEGYVMITPRVNFRVGGRDADSASQIRDLYVNSNDSGRDQILHDLYGTVDQNLRNIFDQRLLATADDGAQPVTETIMRIDPDSGVELVPRGGMGTWSPEALRSNLERKFQSMAEMARDGNWKNLLHVLYSAGVVETMLKALLDYERFVERQGRRPVAKGRDIDISSDYLEEKWSERYKRSIDCDRPRGFSQRAHCQGRKK
jgi:hypothetical protein